jgi:hypothetical protein
MTHLNNQYYAEQIGILTVDNEQLHLFYNLHTLAKKVLC